MQLPDEYQNDPQGRDKWLERENMSQPSGHKEEENKNYEEEANVQFQALARQTKWKHETRKLIEKIFSVNSYFYHSLTINKQWL